MNVTASYFIFPLLQLVCGQCALNIRLHQFENTYNAEIRRKNGVDRVCCCDQGDDTCHLNLTEFSKNTSCLSDKLCDTFFEVSLPDFQDVAPYSAYSFSNVLFGSSTNTDFNYNFQFVLSDSPSKQVCMCARANLYS